MAEGSRCPHPARSSWFSKKVELGGKPGAPLARREVAAAVQVSAGVLDEGGDFADGGSSQWALWTVLGCFEQIPSSLGKGRGIFLPTLCQRHLLEKALFDTAEFPRGFRSVLGPVLGPVLGGPPADL